MSNLILQFSNFFQFFSTHAPVYIPVCTFSSISLSHIPFRLSPAGTYKSPMIRRNGPWDSCREIKAVKGRICDIIVLRAYSASNFFLKSLNSASVITAASLRLISVWALFCSSLISLYCENISSSTPCL